jgi:hypothetical protein
MHCTSRLSAGAGARGGVFSLVSGSKRSVLDATWANLGNRGQELVAWRGKNEVVRYAARFTMSREGSSAIS